MVRHGSSWFVMVHVMVRDVSLSWFRHGSSWFVMCRDVSSWFMMCCDVLSWFVMCHDVLSWFNCNNLSRFIVIHND